MQIIIYMEITPVFFGDCLLLQVVVLVDTANLCGRMRIPAVRNHLKKT
jgi:hypothetical protein